MLENETAPPRYLQEFPGFTPLEFELPEGAFDNSDHNDACPSFGIPSALAFLYVHDADSSKREFPEAPRLNVFAGEMDGGSLSPYLSSGEDACLLITDDYDAAIALVEQRRLSSAAPQPSM